MQDFPPPARHRRAPRLERTAIVPVLAILARPGASQEPPLFPNAQYSAGLTPGGASATGDLDGDGRVDIVATASDGTVAVLLADGRGGLRPPSAYRAFAGASGVAVGDFDEDSVPDLAIACRETGCVAFLRGEGAGRLAPPRASVFVEDACKIAAGDFDGDGHLDVAVTRFHEREIAIFFGDGHGGFGPPVHHSVPVEPFEIVTADFDGDGSLDLAAGASGEYSQGVAVLRNHGDGRFESARAYGEDQRIVSLRVGDLNADGHLDLVYVISGSPYQGARVLHGDGAGGFAHPMSAGYTFYPLVVDVGDLNHDGYDDLVLTSGYPFGIEVEYGHANGQLTPGPRLGLDTWSSDVRIADFDQDGVPDVGVAEGGLWTILRRDAAGKFASPEFAHASLPHGGGQIASADLNGDGLPDVVLATFDGVVTFFGNGSGGFWDTTARALIRSDRSVALADLDQDGVLDVVTGVDLGGIATLRGRGDGTFEAPVKYPGARSYARPLAIADVNGDGRPDVVTAEVEDSRAVVYLGTGGGALGDAHAYPTGVQPKAFAFGDVDGDGIADIATADGQTDGLSVLLGDGRGGFSPPRRWDIPYWTGDLAFADVNGDGRTDLLMLGRPVPSDEFVLAVFLREADGTLRHATDVETPVDGPMSLADLNRDGAVDVLVPDSRGSVWVLLGDGAGGFSRPSGYLVGGDLTSGCTEPAKWALACDLDRDRQPEIVTSGACDGIAVLHKERSGAPGSAICAADGAAASCPCANTGATGHGCENSANTGGAVLESAGVGSLESDSLAVTSSGEPSAATTIFLQGSTFAPQVPLGQGLLCAGGRVLRLFTESAGNGVATAPPDGTSISSRSRALGDPLRPGSIRVYQALYRSNSFGACRSTFNLSSAQQIVWTR
jgi:hypothetical protein